MDSDYLDKLRTAIQTQSKLLMIK